MDQFTMERVTRKSGGFRQIRALYHTAFPREERVPFPVLMACSRSRTVDFWAFYTEGRFCGLAYLVKGGALVALMYLAVVPPLRSKGYGGRILSDLCAHYAGQTVALDIEQILPEAENAQQRRRRRAFYLKNGFYSSGYGHSIRGVAYEILVRGRAFTPEKYAEIFRKFSRGGVRMHLEPLPAGEEGVSME